MPRPVFSEQFRTYGEWLKAGDRTSKYAQEIIRKHKIFPDRNLKYLNSLKMSDIDLSLKPISALTDKEFTERGESLKVLKIMRNEGLTLSKSIEKAKEYGYNPTEKSVRKSLGNVFYKTGKGWKARKTDKIEVRMNIYSNGKEETITVTNSKDRTLIGKYFNDVKKVLHGELDEKTFKKLYKRKTIVDAKGNKWNLETSRKEIEKIETANPNDVYRVIYGTR
jgi:serine protease inhibitor